MTPTPLKPATAKPCQHTIDILTDALESAKRGEISCAAVALVKSRTQDAAIVKWSLDSVALLGAVQHLAFCISESLE